jgi:hypothetical protein
MAATSSIVDDFSSTLNTTRWPANNGVSVTGGQAVLTCNTDYADLSSAFSYTFDSAYAKVTPAPANGGSSGNCYLRMALVANGQADGTFLGIVCDTIEGSIYFQKAVDYWDNSGPGLTYSSTTHAWWKIALSGSNVVFSTSPDGTTWTTRYTTARPSYYNSSSFQLTFEAHRDSGTANTAIVDNVNTTASATVVTGALSLAATGTQALAGIGKTTGALAAAGTGTLTLAGARAQLGVLDLDAAADLDLAGTGHTTGAATLAGGASFAVDGSGTAYAAADLAAEGSLELTGGRIMNPNTAGSTMAATATFTLAGAGTALAELDLAAGATLDAEAAAMTTGGELLLSAGGEMVLEPGGAPVVYGELLLFAEAGYLQWGSKTVVPIAFGYITGEVDA